MKKILLAILSISFFQGFSQDAPPLLVFVTNNKMNDERISLVKNTNEGEIVVGRLTTTHVNIFPSLPPRDCGSRLHSSIRRN